MEGQDVGQWMLGLGMLLGIATLALFWWIWSQKVEAKQQEVVEAQREVDALASVIKEVEDYKAKKAELERKIGIINDLKANQRGPVRVMDYVSRALPELLWLDQMSMKATTIRVEGRAFNTNAVANFIENLDKVPEFDEPTLKSTEEQAGGIYKFVIDFNYSFAAHGKPPAEGAPPGGAPAAAPAAPATSG
jgi:type IV pilus assembly protein PilN